MRGTLALLAGVIALLGPAAAVAAPPDRAAGLEAWLRMSEDTRTPSGWTGNVASCVLGTESAESLGATLRTVNTLRALAGVGPVTFDPALNQRALAAALNMQASGTISHTPNPASRCYSPAAAQAAGSANLYLGLSGPSAMIGYATDDDIPSLGHRRWLLSPRRTVYGSGSSGGANALVFAPSAPTPSIPKAIAWPPPGHMAWRLIPKSWSVALNFPGQAIDASAAQAQVSLNGRPMPVSPVSNMGPSGYTDGHLLKWDVAIADGERNADATATVAITGVKVNGVALPINYSVNAFRADPPLAAAYTFTRAEKSVTVAWQAAVERGVPVTGHRIQVLEMGSQRSLVDHAVGPAAGRVTLAYAPTSKHLIAYMTTRSRAGDAVGRFELLGPAKSSRGRARFVGAVTIKLARPGRMRVGSRLKVKADVRGERRLRYQWRRSGRSIARETRSTYRVRRADRGRRISVRLTATGGDGVAVRRTSSSRLVPRR